MIFHKLSVKEIIGEIDGKAVTIIFDLPEPNQGNVTWLAGQHVVVKCTIRGVEHRRTYSISKTPANDGQIQITVKRTKKGLVSNYLNDHLAVSDILEVSDPLGSFWIRPDKNQRKTYYFFAAGSGITPVFSMLSAILKDEPNSAVYLCYGNKNAKTILFLDQLNKLCEEFPNRLTISHVLSSPSMWSGFDYWCRGRITKDAVEAFINEHPPYAQDTHYLICGPSGMNEEVTQALCGLDVPHSRISTEFFVAQTTKQEKISSVASSAIVRLDGQTTKIEIEEGQTLLGALQDNGLNPPYSCQSGICGACKAKLTGGQVKMATHMALSEEELNSNIILTCQSFATSGNIELDFE